MEVVLSEVDRDVKNGIVVVLWQCENSLGFSECRECEECGCVDKVGPKLRGVQGSREQGKRMGRNNSVTVSWVMTCVVSGRPSVCVSVLSVCGS